MGVKEGSAHPKTYTIAKLQRWDIWRVARQKQRKRGEGSRSKERERKRERQESRTVFVTAELDSDPSAKVNGQRLDSISADPHFNTGSIMEAKPWHQAKVYDQIRFMGKSMTFIIMEYFST